MADNTWPAFPMDDRAVHAAAFDAVKHLQGTTEHEAAYIAARAKLGSGMTLRDYFAAKAMQGMQANPCDEAFGMTVDEHASYAYKMADAMLAAARKGE